MKRHAWFIIRMLLTIAFFVWLFRNPELRKQLAAVPSPSQPGWLIPAWISAGLNEVFGILRWWICLHLAGIPVSIRRAAALHFLGMFTSLFLPGVVGGDAVKIALLALQFPQRKFSAVLAVFMDRLSGFVMISSWLLIAAQIRGDWLRQTPATAAILNTILPIVYFLAAGLLLWFLASRTKLMQRRFPRFPFRAQIVQFESCFDSLMADKLRTISALVLTVLCFLTFSLVYYFSAHAFGQNLTVADILTLMPLIDFITLLPVTISGLGLREAIFQTLLPPLCGIPAASAVIISISGFLVASSWALAGVPAFLAYRSRQKKSPTDPAS